MENKAATSSDVVLNREILALIFERLKEKDLKTVQRSAKSLKHSVNNARTVRAAKREKIKSLLNSLLDYFQKQDAVTIKQCKIKLFVSGQVKLNIVYINQEQYDNTKPKVDNVLSMSKLATLIMLRGITDAQFMFEEDTIAYQEAMKELVLDSYSEKLLGELSDWYDSFTIEEFALQKTLNNGKIQNVKNNSSVIPRKSALEQILQENKNLSRN
jgi:hypothetical protein